jgi:tetratricopeptide (TPR) repeat protein
VAGLALFGITRRTLAHSPAGFGFLRPLAPAAYLPGPAEETPRLIATVLALSVAILWTVHPLQTEAVTYVVQRAESLMGMFYFLTLYFFVRHAEGGPRAGFSGWILLANLACLLGMATKEVMVSAPVMVLLYDRAFFAGSFREAWRRRRGMYVGLAATWGVLLLCILRGGGNRGGSIGFGVGVSPWTYWLTQFEAIGRYVLLVFWPSPLVFEYGAFTVKQAGEFLPWAAMVVPLAAGAIWAFWRQPAIGFLGAWFFVILSPTSLVPGTSQMVVEHRMYLSLAGVLALGVCAGYALLVRWTTGSAGSADHGRLLTNWRRLTAVFLALVLLGAAGLGWLTAERNAIYRSALDLWADTVAKRPRNALAHDMLAEELLEAGHMQEALAHYQEAVQLHPPFFVAHERLGELLVRLGKPEDAAVHFREALRLSPDFADAHDNLGTLLAEQGRMNEALAHFERALELKPYYAEAHYNLANLLVLLRRGPEAVTHFEEAIRLKPGYAVAQYNLANTLADLGRPGDAIAHYEEALRLKPDYPSAEYNLANIFAVLHRHQEAIAHYLRALRLKPDYAAAEMNLGSALFELGRLHEAETHYLAALNLDPNLKDARENLAQVRAAQHH